MKIPRISILPALLFVAWVAAATVPAQAAVVEYFSDFDENNGDLTNSNTVRNAFVATLDLYDVETFENMALWGTQDPALSFPNTGVTAITDFDTVYPSGTYASSGFASILDQGPVDDQGFPDPNGPAFNDYIQFSAPVTAFGAYFVQGGDSGNTNTLTLRLTNSITLSSKDVTRNIGPGWPDENIFFFGVTDTDGFDRVTFIEAVDIDGILLDDFHVGLVTVPEPSSFALLAVGAVAAAVWRRRRRS